MRRHETDCHLRAMADGAQATPNHAFAGADHCPQILDVVRPSTEARRQQRRRTAPQQSHGLAVAAQVSIGRLWRGANAADDGVEPADVYRLERLSCDPPDVQRA